MNQGFTRNHEDAESSCQPSFYRSGKPDFSHARYRARSPARARWVPIENRLYRICATAPAFWCFGLGYGRGYGLLQEMGQSSMHQDSSATRA